jgi:hypothetical protein
MNVTLDQSLRNSSKVYPSEPKVRALHLSASYKQDESVAWTLNGSSVVQVPQTYSPQAAFDRLFGDFTPNLSVEESARRKFLKKSVIDAVLGDYNQLFNSARIGAVDRQRLDSHVSFIRDLEKRLEQDSPAPTGCSAPARPPTMVEYRTSDLPRVLSNHIDVLVAAIRCDLTRVATLGMAFRGHTYGSFLSSQTSHHHSMSHETSAASTAGLFEIDKFLGSKIAELATKLDVVEDPATGSTYLDNTLIYWGHELCGANEPGLQLNHEYIDMPVLFVGGGSFLNTGRYVDYRRVGTGHRFHPTIWKGRPYNDVLVTILQAFGLAPAEYEQNGKPGFGLYHYGSQGEPADYDTSVTAKRTALATVIKTG